MDKKRQTRVRVRVRVRVKTRRDKSVVRVRGKDNHRDVIEFWDKKRQTSRKSKTDNRRQAPPQKKIRLERQVQKAKQTRQDTPRT